MRERRGNNLQKVLAAPPRQFFLLPLSVLFLFVSLSTLPVSVSPSLHLSVSVSPCVTLLYCCLSLQGFKHLHIPLCSTCTVLVIPPLHPSFSAWLHAFPSNFLVLPVPRRAPLTAVSLGLPPLPQLGK